MFWATQDLVERPLRWVAGPPGFGWLACWQSRFLRYKLWNGVRVEYPRWLRDVAPI